MSASTIRRNRSPLARLSQKHSAPKDTSRPRRRATIDVGEPYNPDDESEDDKAQAANSKGSPAATGAATKAPPTADVMACKLALKHRLMLHEVKKVHQEFDAAKQNMSGGLDLDEFHKVMKGIFDVPKVSEDVLQNAYRSTGVEKSIDLDKFLEWYVLNMFTQVNAMNASAEKQASDTLVYELATKFQVSPIMIDKVKQKFDHFDADKSGAICFTEFQNMLVVILKARSLSDISQDRMNKMWKEIDMNKDGSVCFKEFTEWYLKYFNPDAEEVNDFNPFGFGPVEAFYGSFNPQVQRRMSLRAEDRRATVGETDFSD
eukprot:gnl/TRDRNA2_/TRDRNA2_133056_c0_seq2.p1 gnl/TRDRNA2_/TRDRNA2_133056_c0~~gnl/TRDRNA2_/TRDRNA2_133056_c0_seq2.p1  ORF type:complete len:317 (-),score=80.55 gnl/TRDRNA2_/TRDRNA2_133056_c0_seq2:148-1098(-)